MRDDDDADVALTDEESGADITRYLWQPGEREAAYAEVAERQRRINTERLLDEVRRVPVPVVQDKPVKPRPAPGAGNQTQAWRRTVDDRVEKLLHPLLEAIGLELADVRREASAALRTEIQQLRNEIEALRGQIDTARRLDALEQRLTRAEERDPPRVGLRAV